MVAVTAREENGQFCVTVGPVTRTVGILTYSRLRTLTVNGYAAFGPTAVGCIAYYY